MGEKLHTHLERESLKKRGGIKFELETISPGPTHRQTDRVIWHVSKRETPQWGHSTRRDIKHPPKGRRPRQAGRQAGRQADRQGARLNSTPDSEIRERHRCIYVYSVAAAAAVPYDPITPEGVYSIGLMIIPRERERGESTMTEPNGGRADCQQRGSCWFYYNARARIESYTSV